MVFLGFIRTYGYRANTLCWFFDNLKSDTCFSLKSKLQTDVLSKRDFWTENCVMCV